MNRASSSLPGVQPAVKPPDTGCQRLLPLQAGGGSQTPGAELLWTQPKWSSQKAATHRARVHHRQCQGDGDCHTAGLASFTAPRQTPFQTVCERQVCHWDGKLQEWSLAAGPCFSTGCSWLTLYWGEPGVLPPEGVWQKRRSKTLLKDWSEEDMNSISSTPSGRNTCARQQH